MKVSDSAVHRDLAFIRRQAKENLQKHIDERIPEEMEKAMSGMNTILRMTSYIANTETDPRIKLQALSLMNEVFKVRMELTTNGAIVRDALNYVNGKAEKLKNSVSNGALEEEDEDYQSTVTSEIEETTTEYSSIET